MSFTGREGRPITLADASAMTKEYRRGNPNGRKGHFIGSKQLNDLLNQSGAKGIRVYYGIDPATREQELVFVAADAAENDILDLVVDNTIPCPSHCGESNDLNS